MRSKTILVVLFLASIAVLGAVFWRNAHLEAAAETAKAAAPPTMILVAARPVPTGTLLRAEDVTWGPWRKAVPADAILKPTGAILKTKPDAGEKARKAVYGAVIRERVASGNPILSSMIVKPGDRGFLAAVLSPGYRAISIGVTSVSGAAGLIYPGDHVDVLLTQLFTQREQPLSHRAASETIVRNLRVLAVNHELQETKVSRAVNPNAPRTVTLEVLPKQARMISVAADLGKLSLVLRSVPPHGGPLTADDSSKETTQTTWADDVSPALRPVRQRKARVSYDPTVRIMRGSKVDKVRD